MPAAQPFTEIHTGCLLHKSELPEDESSSPCPRAWGGPVRTARLRWLCPPFVALWLAGEVASGGMDNSYLLLSLGPL